MGAVSGLLPWVILAAEVLAGMVVAGLVVFSQVARIARKRAYGPGGGRR